MAFCNNCGASIPDGTTTCAACSARSASTPAAAGSGMTDNVAGMLAYVTFIPAIIFLVTAPYNQSRFVRFHSFQSIFVFVAVIAVEIVLSVLAIVPPLIVVIFPLGTLVGLGALILWIVLLLKANQGQMFKLPVIGDLAMKQAG